MNRCAACHRNRTRDGEIRVQSRFFGSLFSKLRLIFANLAKFNKTGQEVRSCVAKTSKSACQVTTIYWLSCR